MENKYLSKYLESEENKKILELPISLHDTNSMFKVITDRLNKYNKLISDDIEIEKGMKDRIAGLTDGLKKVFEFLPDKPDLAYIELINTFNKTYNENNNNKENDNNNNDSIFNEEYIKKYFVYHVKKGTKLYRLRDGEHIDKLQMFHCPERLTNGNLCNSERFNLEGFPMFYCGVSQHCCELEINHDEDNFTVAEIIAKDEFELVDLSCVNLNEYKIDKEYNENYEKAGHELLYLWPILAMCYIVDSSDKTSANSTNQNPTYLFSQLFAKYIQEYCPSFEGIRYFTVRNPELNSSETTYTDLVFFTNKEAYNNQGYDMQLYKKFDYKIILHKQINLELNLNLSLKLNFS